MYIYNGLLTTEDKLYSVNNRGIKFGDSLFETIRVINGNLSFWEDHYFRLMAGMRIMRMQIPMSFTMEFFEGQIQTLLHQKKLTQARVRITVTRQQGGLYTPLTNKVDFLIEADTLTDSIFTKKELTPYKIDLYRDYKKNKSLLSTIKSNNKLEHILAGIYAQENELDNVILMNSTNQLAESIQSNIFLVKDTVVSTPSPTEGCVKGIIRKKIIEILSKNETYSIEERPVNHFELLQADEVFLTNTIMGIQSVSHFSKKTYNQNMVAHLLIDALNELN